MKTDFYLKHSLMALNDPRIKKLLKAEKLKGIGAYWFIIEKLELLPEPRATLDYLQPFCCKEAPFSYIQEIICNFELFEFDEEGYFMPSKLNPSHKKLSKHAEYSQRGSVFQPKTINSEPENDDYTAKNSENCKKTKTDKALKNNTSANNTSYIKKEYIKEIITTEEKKEKEKKETAAAVAGTNPDTLTPPPAITCCDDYGRPQRPLQPVRPWQEMVKSLTEESQWLEIACMKSNFADLLIRHIEKAVEIFRQHIEVYDKGSDLLTMSDVHRYFINFVSPGSRTSSALHETLLTLEVKEHPTNADPYRYEQRCNGKRTYMGCPIPDNAPPRPDANAIWDEEAKRWITRLNPGQKPG